jgi:hypothetical protein
LGSGQSLLVLAGNWPPQARIMERLGVQFLGAGVPSRLPVGGLLGKLSLHPHHVALPYSWLLQDRLGLQRDRYVDGDADSDGKPARHLRGRPHALGLRAARPLPGRERPRCPLPRDATQLHAGRKYPVQRTMGLS